MTVTLNIFKKPEWDQLEWKIYLNNLKILCRANNLKNKEFSKIVGVENAFRTDIGRPGKGTVNIICNKFNVTEKWLSTPRKITNGVIEFKIEENLKPYDENGGWRPGSIEDFCDVPHGIGFIRAIDMLADIFRSKDTSLIDKTIDSLKSLRDSGTADVGNITYMDPAVRIMNEILREENAELDDDELSAVLEMLRGALEKPKSNTINLIRAFKKGDTDAGRAD